MKMIDSIEPDNIFAQRKLKRRPPPLAALQPAAQKKNWGFYDR
jgi:hypothetical protein